MSYANLTRINEAGIAPDVDQLVKMLKIRRKPGTNSHKYFCKTFLRPVFGSPDIFGNFMMTIGELPRIAFMAHHDSVHNMPGAQNVNLTNSGIVSLPETSKSNCLGADCATGVWLILHMIKNNVPGRYIVHADEETGGRGARGIVKSEESWIKETDACISFDRFGYSSVITHQGCIRTASDAFADSLIEELNSCTTINKWLKDTGGTFTDSDVYSHDVPECTNISVGYMHQHTKRETQDLHFAEDLANGLVNVCWNNLIINRNPEEVEYDESYAPYFGMTKKHNGVVVGINKNYQSYDDYFEFKEEDQMLDILERFPLRVVHLLKDYGLTVDNLVDELQIHDKWWP